MNSRRLSSSLTICLCVQLSVCLLDSSTSSNSSLWGKKIQFSVRPCMWQLWPGTVVPALKELSVCTLLRLNYGTEWTGFVYKAPGQRHIELGLQGTGAHLTMWLFGEGYRLETQLTLQEWHFVCLTWSGWAQRLRVYINGTRQLEVSVKHPVHQQLAPNGTLTMGVSHYVDGYGEVKPESGNNLLGEIGWFGMWAREQRPEEVRALRCAEGDVLHWDTKQWKYSCPAVPDSNLLCDPPPPASSIATTTVEPDTFFRVNLTLSLTGIPANPQDIAEKWVKKQLEVNENMFVHNFVMKDNVSRNMEQSNEMTISDGEKQYDCAFHVQEYSTNTVEESKTLISASLTSVYQNGTIVIQALDVVIKHIVPENCLEETTSTIYGLYIWPESFPNETQKMGCNKPRSKRAYRLCKLDIETDTSSWAHPDMTNCKVVVHMSDLINISVTVDNAAEVVSLIQDLVDTQLANSSELSASDLDAVVVKLTEVVNISTITAAVGADIVNVVADILLSETHITPVANVLLNVTEKMGNKMVLQEDSLSITAPMLALSMVDVKPDGFMGLTFGVSSISPTLSPEISLAPSFVDEPLPHKDACIALPSELHDFVVPDGRNETRFQFNFYGTQKLFQDPATTHAAQSNLSLNSYIVSASINNSHVSGLKDRVVVTLNNQTPKQPEDKVECMFWDFQKNGGQGGWNGDGCETQSISPNQTRCLCDHLTHFAVLLDVSRSPNSPVDSEILTVISYLGCGISSLFLGITLLTYLGFDKLRQDYPAKILINLAAALMGLCLVFLINTWLSSFSNYGLCIFTAATLHYFLLASFTWMGLEAVHMYLALVRVFNTFVPFYIFKLCAVGWGLPLVIVSLVLAIDKDVYGSTVPVDTPLALQTTDPFCWLQSGVFFYITVLAFILLILVCNTTVFVMVLIQIRQMRANKLPAQGRGSLKDLRAVASLTVLLGLSWTMGFLSYGPGRVVLMYLFCIFNSFQGFFIFLFHCLMKENVRKQWRMHLCCGRFRPDSCSDWSHVVTTHSPNKRNNLVTSYSGASLSTTTWNLSESSIKSAANHHRGA